MKTYFYREKPIVGLEISSAGLKVMSVNTRKWTVLGYGSVAVDPNKMRESLDGDGAYLKEELKQLFEKKIVGTLPSNRLIISVPGSRSFSRSISLPGNLKGDLLEAVKLEAEQYIPVPIDQLNLDYEIISRDKETIAVHMCAAPSKLIAICVEAAEAIGFEVVVVEPSMNSVARILRESEQGELPTVIVDIGAVNTDVAVLEGTIKVTDSIGVGSETFTSSIAAGLNIKPEKAHQLKVLTGMAPGKQQESIVAAVSPNVDAIIEEVKKVMRYYTERVPNAKKIEQVIIIGGGSSMPGLGDYFTQNLEMASRVASPWQRLNFAKLPQPAKQFKPRYITVAGLALANTKKVLR